jgi:hypothetical protein
MAKICLQNIKRRRNLCNDRLAYTEITMDIACAEKVGVIRGYIFVSTSEGQ